MQNVVVNEKFLFSPAISSLVWKDMFLMDFDDMLPHVGEFRLYQKILFILLASSALCKHRLSTDTGGHRAAKGLSAETVRLIADSCQQLKKFSLDDDDELFDDDVIYVIDKLGKQLTTLKLSGHNLTDVVYLYLKNCTRLQKLQLYSCHKMTERGLQEGIGSLQKLASLYLEVGYTVTAKALCMFLHRPSMTSIVSLKLFRCWNLDDEGLKAIAERCIHLKKLDISFNENVTDAGISMVIRHCNQLCALNLSFLTYITGEEWLPLVPSHLPNLRQLCLKCCGKVCKAYVEELVAALPELVVIK